MVGFILSQSSLDQKQAFDDNFLVTSTLSLLAIIWTVVKLMATFYHCRFRNSCNSNNRTTADDLGHKHGRWRELWFRWLLRLSKLHGRWIQLLVWSRRVHSAGSGVRPPQGLPILWRRNGLWLIAAAGSTRSAITTNVEILVHRNWI